LAEDDARKVIYQVLQALSYLHGQRIWHRDVKPENILVMDGFDNVVLSDFGYAKRIETETMTSEFCGSAYYGAPELFLAEPYTEKVDIWALGMTMYASLTGAFPFDIAKRDEMRSLIIRGLPGCLDNWELVENASDLARDLIGRMLAKDAGRRISADEALQHPWFDCIREEKSTAELTSMEEDFIIDQEIEDHETRKDSEFEIRNERSILGENGPAPAW
jgi:calcium/calmodulin-dependent protein kinase I